MINNPELQRFLEIRWKRAFTPAEEAELAAYLKANPAAKEEWEADLALTTAMDGLAEPPISSNFTARVLQAIEREDRSPARPASQPSWWQRLVHRASFAWGASMAALALIGGLVFHQNQVQRQHELAKRNLEDTVVLAKALPNAEVLANFDTIRVLSTAPAPDEKLLALLQ